MSPQSIRLYAGLKHSSCSQCINEKGMSVHDVKVLTPHSCLEPVYKYAKTEVSRIRQLMEQERVVDLNSYKTTTNKK